MTEKEALALDAAWQRAEALARIAREHIARGAAAEADHAWELAVREAREGEQTGHAQDSIDASSVLWEVAEDLALVGQTDRAHEVADAIRNPAKRLRALDGLEAIAAGGAGSFAAMRAPEGNVAGA